MRTRYAVYAGFEIALSLIVLFWYQSILNLALVPMLLSLAYCDFKEAATCP